MAAPPSKSQPKNTANASDVDLDVIPMQKTSPLVYVGVVVGIMVIGGAIAFATLGRSKKPEVSVDEAVASARIAAAEAKQKEAAQREHLELAAKAFAVAEEKEKVAAAASAAAAAANEEAHPGAVAGATPGGGTPGEGTPAPPKPKGPSGGEVDELDKLGSAVNSELGGK
jgi:hypothetical protein